MCVNLISCNLCVCVVCINTGIKELGWDCLLSAWGVQEVSIVTNGSLAVITGLHTQGYMLTD